MRVSGTRKKMIRENCREDAVAGVVAGFLQFAGKLAKALKGRRSNHLIAATPFRAFVIE